MFYDALRSLLYKPSHATSFSKFIVLSFHVVPHSGSLCAQESHGFGTLRERQE